MITAKIHFFNNSSTLDLSAPPYEVRDKLRTEGVLTPPSMIMLDNARTLKINLYPEDNMGERILSLVDTETNTLNEVNCLCYHINSMDYRDEVKFSESVDSGNITDLKEALKFAEKLKEQRRIKNKKKDMER